MSFQLQSKVISKYSKNDRISKIRFLWKCVCCRLGKFHGKNLCYCGTSIYLLSFLGTDSQILLYYISELTYTYTVLVFLVRNARALKMKFHSVSRYSVLLDPVFIKNKSNSANSFFGFFSNSTWKNLYILKLFIARSWPTK